MSSSWWCWSDWHCFEHCAPELASPLSRPCPGSRSSFKRSGLPAQADIKALPIFQGSFFYLLPSNILHNREDTKVYVSFIIFKVALYLVVRFPGHLATRRFKAATKLSVRPLKLSGTGLRTKLFSSAIGFCLTHSCLFCKTGIVSALEKNVS